MFFLAVLVLATASLTVLVSGQYASDFPSPVPLLVRTPYFGSWVGIGNRTANGSPSWNPALTPTAWNGREQSWYGAIRMDGTTYSWLGGGVNPATTEALHITPTRTVVTMRAGPTRFNVTFMNPIEPSDWVRQSFPFAYVSVDAWSTDGSAHSLEVYLDVTGEFVSSSATSAVEWYTGQPSESFVYHWIRRSSAPTLIEENNLAEDGTMYLAMKAPTNGSYSWQTGVSGVLRSYFAQTGRLNSTSDNNFRAIAVNQPALAMTAEIGSFPDTVSSVVFALGLVRDPVVRSVRDGGVALRRSLYQAYYNSVPDAVSQFLTDYPNALARAIQLDTKVMTDATAISPQYADLVAVSMRQVFSSFEITTIRDANDKWDTTDVKAFMKDIGNSRRANPVDVIYAALPSLLYLNASLAGLLLDPILQSHESPAYAFSYAAPDIGSFYPDAVGNYSNDPLLLGVEDSSSMLIMCLAHAQKSGQGSLIFQHYALLKKWADYLVKTTLKPEGYISADNLNAPMMSNLALKGIIGIHAMAVINQLLEPQGMLSNWTMYYQGKAQSYATEWMGLAWERDHIASSYGNTQAWGLVYNLYASRLLNTSLISPEILDQQAAWYISQAKTAPKLGFEYDSTDPGVSKTHWSMFTAASIANDTMRDVMISSLHDQMFLKNRTVPCPTVVDPKFGDYISGAASPAQGAMFALLALNVPNMPVTIPREPHKTDLDAATIAGGVVGGVSGVLLSCLAIWFWRKRRQRQKEGRFDVTAKPLPHPDGEQAGVTQSARPDGLTPYLLQPSNSQNMAEYNPASSATALMAPLPYDATSASSKRSRLLAERASVDANAAPVVDAGRPDPLRQTSGKSWQSVEHLRPPGSVPSTPTPSSSVPPGLGVASTSMQGTSATGASLSPPPTGSGTDVEAVLRTEVEQLRREMEVLRSSRVLLDDMGLSEPPPMYTDRDVTP